MPRRRPDESLKRVWSYLTEEILFPFQVEWIADESRFKICLKARQIGISESLGVEACLDVLRGESVYFVSRTENQSIYLLDKFYKWMEFFIAGGVGVEYQAKTNTGCKINGVDVRSLTSNAVAGEGFTGNVYLDEFGLHENDEQIYRSLYPTITWGYKIRLVSRPFGQANKFYEIWTNTDRYPDFSRHRFDIYRALDDGLPIDIEELRRNLDEEGFRENYLCEFVDESTAYIPYKLIRGCVGDTVSGDGDRFLGVDIGRKHDYTVVYVLRQLGDELYTEELHRLKNKTFEKQKEFITEVIQRTNTRRGGIDASGLGMQLGEELHRRFSFIEQVTFTADVKERLAVLTKRKMEEGKLRIPDDHKLISAIHAIKRMVTAANNIRFDAQKTKDGHADEFWALALSVYSAVGRSRMKVRQY